MKTLKTILVALFITFTAAKASTPTINEKLTVRYAISTYLDAFTHGKTSGLADIVDDNAKFSHMRGQQVVSFSKIQILESLKNQQDVEQNCKTTARIVENSATLVVYKVQMKYENFSRVNYVTMTDTGAGWKITNISTVFN